MSKQQSAKRERGKILKELHQVFRKRRARVEALEPTSYNMPDLLFPPNEGETDVEYRLRQNEALRDCVENHLWFEKDGEKRKISAFPKVLEFMADLFFLRVSKAILWGPRGGGKSLCCAALLWLLLVYRKKSVLDVAGSSEQAKIVYEYTKGFWRCHPSLAKALLICDPLQTETRLRNNVVMKCVGASEKQARGKHLPIYASDETCQASSDIGGGGDKVVRAGMQGALSEPGHIILFLSTFHHPVGLFQEVWDNAEEMGFTRYKFNIYDAMETCRVGLDYATPADPLALAFCRERCPLTSMEEDEDGGGGFSPAGCNGTARNSHGYQKRDHVIAAKRLNLGTDMFRIEWECNRPTWMQPIYNNDLIDQGTTHPDHFMWQERASCAVGIDWGYEGQTSIVLAVLGERFVPAPADPTTGEVIECIGILEAAFRSATMTRDIIDLLISWQQEHGLVFPVYGDVGGPGAYNNRELEEVGFDVQRVAFNKWKEPGIVNVQQFLGHGRLCFMTDQSVFLQQVKKYRRGKAGKPVKNEDHGPDALMCAMLHFSFAEVFGSSGHALDPAMRRAARGAAPAGNNEVLVF